MIRLQKIVALIIIVCFFSTCLDDIDLEVPATESVLVVGGNIYTQPGPYSIFLSESAQFASGPEGSPDPVLGAVVKIRDNAGNCLLYTSPSPRDRTRSRMPSSA